MIFDPDDLRTLRPWLIDHVCRFWLARIHDPAGGFFENLDALGAPVATPRRTTLVQARLTYVYSHAYLLSGDPVFREAAKHGLAFLMRAARAPDGGWFRVVSVEGATLDNTRDAYDHAGKRRAGIHAVTMSRQRQPKIFGDVRGARHEFAVDAGKYERHLAVPQ